MHVYDIDNLAALWVSSGYDAALTRLNEVVKEQRLDKFEVMAIENRIRAAYNQCTGLMKSVGLNIGDRVEGPHGPGSITGVEYYSRLNNGTGIVRYQVRLDVQRGDVETLSYFEGLAKV